MTSYFELTELHIHPRAQGRGLGEALARRLLADRSEAQRAALDAGDRRRSQPRVAVVPAAGLHGRHPRLPFRRRPAGVRDPGPHAAAVAGIPAGSPEPPPVWHDDLVRASSPPLPARESRDPGSSHAAGCWPSRCCCCWSPWPPAACGSGRRSPSPPMTWCPGSIIAAAKPKSPKDPGPQLDRNLPFSQKVAVSNYDSDGYVGSQAVFSDLTFAELPQLAHMNSDAAGRESVAAQNRQPGDSGRARGSDVADRSRRRRGADRRLPRRRDLHQR